MATRYRFGLEAYERLCRGVPHVELIRGEVYQMGPMGPKPAVAVARLVQRFAEELGEKAVIWPQNPIRSLDHDLNTKLPLYAEAGIPEVWILDLGRGRPHLFRNPRAGVYTEPQAFPGVRIEV
ncbi:Uma2 family endonuclease [Thermus oshimai]|uniref:Uma2 family endonuclease n=1 Tax=Thermus oshimai TaxID=56957 RepID=UPI0005716790|nr:Uma2 family endonuclease [Thermus oshimai]